MVLRARLTSIKINVIAKLPSIYLYIAVRILDCDVMSSLIPRYLVPFIISSFRDRSQARSFYLVSAGGELISTVSQGTVRVGFRLLLNEPGEALAGRPASWFTEYFSQKWLPISDKKG